MEALRTKYASKLAALENKEARAAQRLEREKSQATSATLSTAVSVGGSLLGALFGNRRGGSFGKVSSAARGIGRATQQRADVGPAEADVQAVREQIAAMNAELEAEIDRLGGEFDPNAVLIDTVAVRPKKADITVEDMALVWCP